jgi:hypothetical protein
MSLYDQNRPLGTPGGPREALPVNGLDWADAAHHTRIHPQNFHPPVPMRDMSLAEIEPGTRPHFFRGKQIGEQAMHDDRAPKFLLKPEDGQRAHEPRLEEKEKAKENEARREAKGIPKMPAPASHPRSPAEPESAVPINDVPAAPADTAPSEVVEVAPPHLTSPPRGRGVREEERANAIVSYSSPLGGEVG